MRSDLTEDEIAARSGRLLVERHFVSIWPRDRSTGDRVQKGWWTGEGWVEAPVIDPDTGIEADPARVFEGGGSLIELELIPLGLVTAVRDTTIRLSQVAEAVRAALLAYEPSLAPVQIHVGLLDPDTRLLLAPARCIFDGWLDEIILPRAAEGEQADAELRCSPRTRELTRTNPDTRSDASQSRRLIGGTTPDRFFRYAGQEWEVVWGETVSRAAG